MGLETFLLEYLFSVFLKAGNANHSLEIVDQVVKPENKNAKGNLFAS